MSRKRNNEPSLFTYVQVEEEPVTQHNGRTDIQQVIRDCLRRVSKDGLAWGRSENIENCFW